MIKNLALGILLCASTLALAQPYPSRPVRLVVGFAPGGAADFVSRAFQDSLGKALGQPIVVENRPGAGSSIAAEHVAKSAPDGYTVLIASPSSILVNPLISPKPGFQPLKDLIAIGKVSSSPLILSVNPGIGVSSVQELIAHAKKNPGKRNFATSGNGSAPHLAAVLFLKLAGDTQLSFATPPSVLPLVQAGRLRALAVTSRTATPLLPGIPGMGEALPDYEISFWYGFFVPAGTPPEVVGKLFDATSQALKTPDIGRILAKEGTETASSASPEEFARFLAEDAKLWARLVKESGAKAD